MPEKTPEEILKDAQDQADAIVAEAKAAAQALAEDAAKQALDKTPLSPVSGALSKGFVQIAEEELEKLLDCFRKHGK